MLSWPRYQAECSRSVTWECHIENISKKIASAIGATELSA